jgi:hypothetical protein
MPILEDLKEYAERATGLRRPGRRRAPALARPRKPHTVRFKDDGLVPNHPRWPLIIYRGAVNLGARHDPAAVIEDLFEANGWGETWRNGVYDYVHYHSRIHEVLGVTSGKGRVRFGGAKGRIFTRPGTSSFFRLARAINAFPPMTTSSSWGPIRRPAPTTSAPRWTTGRGH